MKESSCRDMTPTEIRRLVSREVIKGPTCGMSAEYAKVNLLILDGEDAESFEEFARLNPQAFPVIEITKNTPFTSKIVDGGNILADFSRYRVWVEGKIVNEPFNVNSYWQEGMRSFLIGSSCSFDERLLSEGIEPRHINMGSNLPIYKTDIEIRPTHDEKFRGHLAVSMRPIKQELVNKAARLASGYPYFHGTPVYAGEPGRLGIADLNDPDYGDPVYIHQGEVPMFWASSMTIQYVLEEIKLPFAITNSPGHLMVTDIKVSDI